jgi:hypothetical protein
MRAKLQLLWDATREPLTVARLRWSSNCDLGDEALVPTRWLGVRHAGQAGLQTSMRTDGGAPIFRIHVALCMFRAENAAPPALSPALPMKTASVVPTTDSAQDEFSPLSQLTGIGIGD